LDVVQYLALEVGLVDHVVVDDADRADARGREVQARGRAEPARTEQQHLGVEQLALPDLADLGQHDVPAVALDLLGRQHARPLEWKAGVLPRTEAAGHRGHLLVAQLAQRARAEGRAGPTRAVDDDLVVAIGDQIFDLQLEKSSWDPLGRRDEALLVLVALADVDQHGRCAAVGDPGPGVLDRDLADALLDLRQDLVERRHFPELSGFIRLAPFCLKDSGPSALWDFDRAFAGRQTRESTVITVDFNSWRGAGP